MKFKIKASLAEYASVEEIDAALAEANAELDEALTNEAPTAEDAADAEALAAAIVSLSAEKDARETAASDAVTRMAALRESRVTASNDDEVVEDEEEEDPEAEVEEPEDEEEEVEEPAPAPVRAAATTKARVALAGRKPAHAPAAQPTRKPVAITAAADIRGFSTGQSMDDLLAVAEATINRAKGFPQPVGIPGGQMQRYPVAQFAKQFDEDMVADGKNDQEVIDAAAKEARLPGGSLVAAGGWCAPSETLYDMCVGETTEGLISLPETQWKRGGIRFTPGPSFASIYAGTGFSQTEAQAIAGTAKACYEVTCPSFTEVRLDAKGLCIKVPLLTNAAWPELVRRVISGGLIAHQHRVSAGLITAMSTFAGAAVVTRDVGSATGNALDSVELLANTLRQEYRMSFNQTMEVVAPYWLKSAIRADLAMRTGLSDSNAVTDAQIDSYFAARKAHVQYVYNWQDLVEGEEGYPATADLLLYPAGTFVKGTADVVNLDAVYDAAELSVNRYTGLFFEEGVGIANTCWKAKKFTINVKAAGITGAASNATSFTLT